jgi:H+/Cl- antiporter ClcA
MRKLNHQRTDNPLKQTFREKVERLLETFRDRISYQDALPQLVGLGMVSGLCAAALVVLFRLQVEGSLGLLFQGSAEDFESLSPAWRFLLPFLGALSLGLLLSLIDRQYHIVGVFHVLERLRNHQGRLPGRNLLVQFFGGSIALISGQSVGREGPGVHLGAGIASLLGQWFELPNNAMRTLIACGAAAAIAAAFNTPMAGVIFAMEVILMEYTIVGFIPVIIASVLGSVITQLVFGTDTLIVVPPVELNLLWEIPFMVYAGLLYAIAAVAFIRIHLFMSRRRETPVLNRYLLIGLLTGSVAIFLPQILGAGYDTLNQLIAGEIPIGLLIAIVVAKLIVTASVTGLGMVGGLIGPLLVIGGCLGGVLGVIGNGIVTEASTPEFYVVLGMVAMMGAVLNAPLAALVTILELSSNPAIIFPSMLMVVVACVAVQQLFKCQGIFAEQLRYQGLASYEAPARQFLSRVGVRSVMNTSLTLSPPRISLPQAESVVRNATVWIVIKHEDDELQLISTADLAKHLEAIKAALEGGDSSDDNDPGSEQLTIDLTRIAAQVFNTGELDSKSNLYQASQAIQLDGKDALCVTRRYGQGRSVVGVLTRDAIQKFYGI